MPHVDIDAGEDYASIHYRTNCLNSTTGGFDDSKPLIVLLHPQILDIAFLDPYFDQPGWSCFGIPVLRTVSRQAACI